MICRATLLPINKGDYSNRAAEELFNGFKPIVSLPFSRKEFFTEGPRHIKGMSISGVQQKLSLIINDKNEFEIVSVGGTFILKPSPESFPFAAENEHCAMALSRLAGISTAWSALVVFSDGEEAYITKRYDRKNGLKLHQEDLAQGFNIPAASKYSKSYEESLALVHAMSGGKLSAVRDLFNRVVFAYLIGNDDMHLKNISMIKSVNNRSQYYDSLTPNYDQLFSSSFENSSAVGFLALDLLKEENEAVYTEMYQKYGFYTGSDFLTLAKRAGLPEAASISVLNNYFTLKNELIEMINRSFMPDGMKKKAVSILRDRVRALRIF